MKLLYSPGAFKDSRVPGGSWGIRFKMVVPEGATADIVQTVKPRKGKSVAVTDIRITGEAMRELVRLYHVHPDSTPLFNYTRVYPTGEDLE